MQRRTSCPSPQLPVCHWKVKLRVKAESPHSDADWQVTETMRRVANMLRMMITVMFWAQTAGKEFYIYIHGIRIIIIIIINTTDWNCC